MPYARDKIIINGNRNEGMAFAIESEYKNLRLLAAEIAVLGKDKETAHFRDAMIQLCADKLAADQKYLDGIRQVVADMAAFIDQHS